MAHPLESLGVRTRNDPVAVEQLKRVMDDYDWFMKQHEHLHRYKGLVVLVYKRTVYGSGRDHREAFADAERRAAQQQQPLPPRPELLPIVVPENPWIDEQFLPPRARTTNGTSPEAAES
jgi:hypothetical protein